MSIRLDGISKRYGEKVVFDRFSCEIPIGKWTVVTGPSGCGKTTLFRILLGLEKIDSGKITELPRICSAVFQENRLLEEFSVRENVRIAADHSGKNGRDRFFKKLEEALAQTGLSDCIDQTVSELSGGMKRRVAVARAVLTEAEFYLLDEPFYGLDEKTKEDVMQFLCRNLDGKTVLMITHDADALEYLNRQIPDCCHLDLVHDVGK